MEAISVASKPQHSLWSSLVEAVRGSHQDYTEGSLNRAILLLAVPMVLEMVLESLFAVVDVFWVGRLGANAVATVGLTESMLSLVFAVGMGLSLSTTAMVARRIGEKDPEGAADAGVQAIALGLIVSLAIGLPCLLLAPRLLRLMGASPEIVAVGSGYTRICLGGSCAVLLLFLNNAIFRGAGDAAIAMRLLWVSNIINLILDPCLIFGWGPFPQTGRDRGRAGDLHRAQHWRDLPVLSAAERDGADSHPDPADSVALECSVAAGAGFADRNPAVCHRAHQLDWAGAHREHFRRGCARGIHDRHSHRHFRDPAFVGIEQRGGHAGGAESGRGQAGARRKRGVAHRPLQHDFSGGRGRVLRALCRAGGAPVHARSLPSCRWARPACAL